MTEELKNEITRISKEFAKGLEGTFDTINEGAWLIVEPLSAYLNALGYHNRLDQIPAKEDRPIILILTFKDGIRFVPTGKDLEKDFTGATNYLWL